MDFYRRHLVRPIAGITLLAGLAACASEGSSKTPPDALTNPEKVLILDPARLMEDDWQRLILVGDVFILVDQIGSKMAIKLSPAKGAGGIMRRVDVDPAQCSTLTWSWSVPVARPAADLTTRDGDDVEAAIYVLFGDPGMMFAPDPVPTLRYVATNDKFKPGSVVPSAYMPDTVKSVIVGGGVLENNGVVRYTADLNEDFRRAFGRDDVPVIRAVALYADSDQTGEDINSYFLDVWALCNPA